MQTKRRHIAYCVLSYCNVLLYLKERTTRDVMMQQPKKVRPFQRIMRKHAKASHIQKRQSDLLMTYANDDHKLVAQIIQAWLNEQQIKP